LESVNSASDREEPSVTKQGRHFLQIPGPSPVPDRILRAIDAATIDHRGPDFADLGFAVLEGLGRIMGTKGRVFIYPASGTGAWEAALVNTLSPGDGVLMFETGHFATLWSKLAKRLGLDVNIMQGSWRTGVDAAALEEVLARDTAHRIKAVCCVHNETSTGVLSRIPQVREAIDRARHPALLMVDTISSLGSAPYRHDEWGVDVTIGCSQKGLMLPPGLSFNGVSQKALAEARNSRMPHSYWNWEEMIAPNDKGYFPYTPPTNLLYGLREAIAMMEEIGLETIFARHARHAAAVRAAVGAWGLGVLASDPNEYSPVLTAVMMPDERGADALRSLILERFDLSLGTGLGKLSDKVFRIGHLGDINDLTVIAGLSGVEMGLGLAGVDHRRGGVQAAMDFLAGTPAPTSH
jgi:alanine-glyoxylate transaminase / serine-glyoxylate transaminase / serine-pyruvate transaminase